MNKSKNSPAMNQPNKLRRRLEALLIIAAILILTLTACVPALTPMPTGTLIPSAVMPTSTSKEIPVTATLTVAQEPPPCIFPLAQITMAESVPENYTFSEPKVVLTAPKGNIYHIAQWLPDNQQVLMIEELRNVVIENNNPLQESIDLFNPEKGTSKVIATRALTPGLPSWLPQLNAVAYPAINYTSFDRENRIAELTRQVWVSYGNPNTKQKLADNLSQLLLAVKPGGGETIYLSGKQISKLDGSLNELPSVSFDLSQWDYAKSLRNTLLDSYEMAWQPGTSLIFLYSNNYFGGGGYTFILNADTGQVCELNLGGWVATGAHWSSDGRYLAIGMAATSHLADLALLDTVTGKLTTLAGAPRGINGQLYVNDLIWAPDNHHLLAIGSVVLSQKNQSASDGHGLYLVDIGSGQSVYVEYKSIVSSEDNNWAWSPDGSKLVMRCPTQTVDQICLISVQKSG